MKVAIQVPATMANLGCGFDCFGLALPIYNTIIVEETVLPTNGVEINIIDERNQDKVINIPTDKNNVVFKAIELLYNSIGQQIDSMKITIKTQIPIARGLGSSASVVIGGLMAANELLQKPADEAVLLSIATEIEGHPDNIAPAIAGGITLANWDEDGSVIYRKLPWNDKEWKITACIPDYELATEISRSVLPTEVPMKDAVFNLRRTAMFVQALHTKDEELLKLALRDKLHQPHRKKLVPGLVNIMDSVRHIDGNIGCFLSGAGPAIGVISRASAVDEVKEKITTIWNDYNVNVQFYTLPLDETGAKRIL